MWKLISWNKVGVVQGNLLLTNVCIRRVVLQANCTITLSHVQLGLSEDTKKKVINGQWNKDRTHYKQLPGAPPHLECHPWCLAWRSLAGLYFIFLWEFPVLKIWHLELRFLFASACLTLWLAEIVRVLKSRENCR